MIKAGGGDLNDFFISKFTHTLDEGGSSPKVVLNIYGGIHYRDLLALKRAVVVSTFRTVYSVRPPVFLMHQIIPCS